MTVRAWLSDRISGLPGFARPNSGVSVNGGPVNIDLMTAEERKTLAVALLVLMYSYDGSFRVFTRDGQLAVVVT